MLLTLIDHSKSLIELQKIFVFSVTWGIFSNADGNYLFIMILPRVHGPTLQTSSSPIRTIRLWSGTPYKRLIYTCSFVDV